MTSAKDRQYVLTQEALNTTFAEAYRTLRANIIFSSIDEPIKTILVTSAGAGEGKTTTLLNLGIIMAQASPRVFAVDADFRHPMLQQLVGFERNGSKPLPGLSSLITGTARLDQLLLPTGFPRLAVIPSGMVPPNPGELLGSQRMRATIQELASQADYVLFDSPPCAQYADALVLSSMVDGVVYVVRAGTQDRTVQKRVQRQLQQAKARMVGVVFNDADSARPAGRTAYTEAKDKRAGSHE